METNVVVVVMIILMVVVLVKTTMIVMATMVYNSDGNGDENAVAITDGCYSSLSYLGSCCYG